MPTIEKWIGYAAETWWRARRGNEHATSKWRAGGLGEQEAKGLTKGDSSRETDGDGIICNRKCDWKDAATSGTRWEAKRVETKSLAKEDTG